MWHTVFMCIDTGPGKTQNSSQDAHSQSALGAGDVQRHWQNRLVRQVGCHSEKGAWRVIQGSHPTPGKEAFVTAGHNSLWGLRTSLLQPRALTNQLQHTCTTQLQVSVPPGTAGSRQPCPYERLRGANQCRLTAGSPRLSGHSPHRVQPEHESKELHLTGLLMKTVMPAAEGLSLGSCTKHERNHLPHRTSLAAHLPQLVETFFWHLTMRIRDLICQYTDSSFAVWTFRTFEYVCLQVRCWLPTPLTHLPRLRWARRKIISRKYTLNDSQAGEQSKGSVQCTPSLKPIYTIKKFFFNYFGIFHKIWHLCNENNLVIQKRRIYDMKNKLSYIL